jgi:hypothetical protein
MKITRGVTPAKAGVHCWVRNTMDARFRWNDVVFERARIDLYSAVFYLSPHRD